MRPQQDPGGATPGVEVGERTRAGGQCRITSYNVCYTKLLRNVALGMAAVKLGAAVWRLGDVGEFLLVLSCMAFFVAGLIADEEESAASGAGKTSPNQSEEESNEQAR